MRLFLVIILVLLNSSLFGQNKQVCFTFDDLPVVHYGIADTSYQRELFYKLVESIKKNEIPAIGFVNEKKLYGKKNIYRIQVEFLENWVNNGLELGNHTYSHMDYNDEPFDTFVESILKGERITKEILKQHGKSILYFRHPFLHVGKTKGKADSLSNFLQVHGYKIAPVTIDNEDYLFALAYKRAKSKDKSDLMLQIGHDYVCYMEKKLKYYEKQALALFGRNINQILILHANSLNSNYVDSLALLYRRNKYTFISLDQALSDSVYNTEITVFGDWGISWIDKWALSLGKKGAFFKDDPITPDYIKKMAE